MYGIKLVDRNSDTSIIYYSKSKTIIEKKAKRYCKYSSNFPEYSRLGFVLNKEEAELLNTNRDKAHMLFDHNDFIDDAREKEFIQDFDKVLFKRSGVSKDIIIEIIAEDKSGF